MGLEKLDGISPTLRPLQGLPPINRGGMKTLLPGSQFTTVVSNHHSPPEDAEMIAVSIGLQADDQSILSSNQIVGLVGRIQWGIGGANFEALFDVYDGLVFSVPACKLKIDVKYPEELLDDVPSGNNAINVNVGLAYGTSIEPSTRKTSDLGVIVAGGSFQDIIPAFATSFTVLASPVFPGPPIPTPIIPQPLTSVLVSETTLAAAGERLAYFQLVDNTNTSLHFENQFPLFNGARVVTITNNGAAAQYEIVYNLAF
jgi:hypothetical protein